MPLLLALSAVARAGVDPDGDHLSDAREAVEGTDPLAWDTDGDGVPDGAEVVLFASDPLLDESPACEAWHPGSVTDTAGQPLGFALADLDADGDLDVVSADFGDSVVRWYANDGDGTFGPRQGVTSAALAPVVVAAADIDGDGDDDLVSGSAGDDEIAWYPNLGGSFGVQQIVGTSQDYPASIAPADLDADGDLDLLVGSLLDDELAWYENLGGGAFGPMILLSGQGDGVEAVGAADLDGDGDLDPFAASYSDDEVAWHENLGGGVFGPRTVITTAIDAPTAASSADVDGDGDGDLVVVGVYGGDVVENLGGGAFALGGAIDPSFVTPTGLTMVDLDADGDPDFAVSGTNGIEWFENVGGIPGPALEVVVERDVLEPLVAGDLDGDGDLDLLGGKGEVIKWFANNLYPGEPDADLLPAAVELCITGSDPATDDTDGGGTPDGEEILAFGDPLDPTDDRPPADTDGDGLHDLVERFLLLTDPLYADSDGDGLRDPEELGGGTDPLTADTDGDGAPDGAERLLLGTDPLLDDAAACDGVEHPMVLDPDMIDVADVDGDGDIDVIGGDNLAPTVRWWSNLGGGTLGAATGIGGTLVSRVRAADFDQDGDPDVAWSAPTSDQIGWFENLGGGAFGPSRLISTTQDSPTDPVAADVDGDGDLDLVVASYLDDTVAWYPFNAGTFGPEIAIDTSALGVNAVVAADLDGDGDPEVVAAAGDDRAYRWYENLGGGAFGPANVLPTGAEPGNLANPRVADGDGDGDLDLFGGGYDVGLTWYENLGGQISAAEQVIAPGWSANDLVVADFDGDADVDLVISATSALFRFDNLGDGAFGPAIELGSDGNLNGVTAADLDGDGDLDPVWMGYSGCGWLNNTWSDLDQDGLSEATESCLTATDPLLPDTDAGGTADARELLDLTDPLFAADDVPHLTLALAANTWTVGGALPGGTVVVAGASSRAPRSVPGCPGLVFDLDHPAELARGPADASGNAALLGPLPPAGTTGWFQAVDRTGCRVSDPLELTIP